MQSVETVNSSEINWQVEVGGQIYDASFDELTQWIAEGALQPQDKVRRGNLRWREANKIPSLVEFFNAKQLGLTISTTVAPAAESVSQTENSTIQNTSQIENSSLTTIQSVTPQVSQVSQAQNFHPEQEKQEPKVNLSIPTLPFSSNSSQNPGSSALNICAVHPETEAGFVCSGCAKLFCQACPKSFGSVRLCPECGELCKAVSEVRHAQNKNVQYQQDVSAGFGLADFSRAFAYPFKFSFSLVSGAILFMFFTLGQSAWVLGDIFLIVAAIFSWMLANTLSFGILANTVENFSHGKIDINFMPSFEEFNTWDDVIHPFFLSIASYIVSFGLLIAIIAGGYYFSRSAAADTESANLKQTLANINSTKSSANQLPSNGAMTVEDAQASRDNQAKQFEQLEAQLKQAQTQSQQETAADSAPPTDKIFSNISKFGKLFGIGIFIALLWGAFYFPAACTVAGYTRSFAATLNPAVGLDTIKRLGADYVKILFFSLVIVIFAAVINYVLSIILAPLDLPQFGNLAVKAIGSLFTFYFSIVFSVMLGFALYKNSDKLNLKRE